MYIEVVVIFALILANGVFSGAEIAVIALRKTRMQEMLEEGRNSAAAVLALRAQPERFLATVQVGITVVGSTAAAFGGSALAKDLAPVLAQWDVLAPAAEEVSLGLVISVVSYFSIVIGELVPKSLALRHAERFALVIGKPLLALSFVARPLIWFLTVSSNFVLRPFGDQTNFSETRHSPEELQQLVEEAMAAGTVDLSAGEIASRALELPSLLAADVMVPRGQVIGLDRSATPEDIRKVLLRHPHSRMPVFEGNVDHVIGYVSVKDLLAVAWEQDSKALGDVIRPPQFVPGHRRAVDLLKQMQAQHNPLAVVVDEHGGLLGIVTLEDLLEELVGEIFNEQMGTQPQRIIAQADGTAVLSGSAAIRDVNRELEIELPEDGAFNTVAGLCLAHSGNIPQVGEKFSFDHGLTIEVVDASPQRIRTVRISGLKSA
jgi:putative hemolysin